MEPVIKYTAPLAVYVLWHPKFDIGEKIFKTLYENICRDINDPLSRGMNIPVYGRSMGMPSIPAIDFAEADQNAVVILVDEEMFMDKTWRQYISRLMDTSQNCRFYPVKLFNEAHEFNSRLKEFQFINFENWATVSEFEKNYLILLSRLLHELSRQLMRQKPSYAASRSEPPPVKLFISHSKIDGETIAKDFRNYLRNNTKLASFFDASDIPDGYKFSEEISKAFSTNAVVVVLQTDAYSSREWCRKEIIFAKRFKTPIVVANAIEYEEKRSFPYLGNVPVIRWKHNFEELIISALSQILRQLHSELILRKTLDLYLPDGKNVEFITSPPELFNYVDIVKTQEANKTKKLYILYPDPPIGAEELQLLNEIDTEVEFITPITLPKRMK